MRRTRLPLLAVLAAVLVLGLLGGACSDGPSADERAFCERLGRLTQDDPFAAFGPRATSADVREAFSALVERAGDLADVAPEVIRGPARDYAEAAEALDDLLAAADYDGDRVDLREYREQQVAYTKAAATLERHLAAEC